MALNVMAINAAKPRDKAYKLADSLGLYLLVAPSGGRLWRMRAELAELLIEARHLKPYALRLAHQLVDLPEGLGQRMQFRQIYPGQVLSLIDQAACLVLQRFDLVIDLLKRSRGCQDVLAVIARIEDDEGLRRRCWQRKAESE